jgi:hypothetical protein
MDFVALGKVIVEVGILPAVIAALLYLIFKLMTENNKAITALTCALSENTSALTLLAEFVKGRAS